MTISSKTHTSKRMVKACFVFLVSILCTGLYAQAPAFPGASGWAAGTPGGRGGKILKVTSLEAEGEGTFLEAIKTKGKRIIVFEVGGIIDLKGKTVVIDEPFLTIAGQTAPSPGITFIDGGMSIKTHDIICRHIRIRTGASRHQTGWEPDGMSTVSAKNVIIDQCSFTWAVDENCSASGPRFNGDNPEQWRSNTSNNITISNNIIAEGLSQSTHPKGEHSKGTLIHDNATNILILKNLFASNVERNVLFKGGARGIQVNNYIHNPGKRAIQYALSAREWEDRPFETGKLTIIGNSLQLGPSSAEMPLILIGNGPCEVYMDDNLAFDSQGKPASLFAGDSKKLVKQKPIWIDNMDLIPASRVKDSVLQNAGARPWDRDYHDQRIIDSVKNGTAKIINSENEVGGYPVVKPTYRKFDKKQWNLDDMTEK